MITNLWVFDDDQQILEFLMNDETFKGAIIDDEEHQDELKFDNFIPKGVRTLRADVWFKQQIQKTSKCQDS